MSFVTEGQAKECDGDEAGKSDCLGCSLVRSGYHAGIIARTSDRMLVTANAIHLDSHMQVTVARDNVILRREHGGE